MELKSNEPVVGIIFDKRGDPPYISVDKLWNETMGIISEKFQTEILEVDSYKVDDDEKYRKFIDKIDVLMTLSPYYSINRYVKEFPLVAYGLGSMQKGGHWLYDNRNSFRSYDSIILNCTSCQNIFNKLVVNNSIKSSLAPFGVDTSAFYPISNKSGLRNKYNIPQNAFIMLYCGRINLQKNVPLLISLLRDMEKKYKNLYLMIIGSFDDFYIPEFSYKSAPDVKKEFYDLLTRYDLTSKIIMFENQSDTETYAELINTADIGINLTTLISENFGYTPVEMQACGLPVVGADWGGLKDTVIDGCSGYKIQTVLSRYGPRINIEQAKDRIEKLINDKSRLELMKEKARKNAEKNYSLDLFSKNLQNIISETYERFNTESNKSNLQLQVNPIVRDMSAAIRKSIGNDRHISWEHLHPNLDINHYYLFAGECVSAKAEQLLWNQKSAVSKAFDWEIIDGRLFSNDPRWNQSFELENMSLSDEEINILKLLENGLTVQDLFLVCNGKTDDIYSLLEGLTVKGLIMPFNNKGI